MRYLRQAEQRRHRRSAAKRHGDRARAKCAVADKREPSEALVERRGRVVVSFANVRRASGSMQMAQGPRTERGDMVERGGTYSRDC